MPIGVPAYWGRRQIYGWVIVSVTFVSLFLVHGSLAGFGVFFKPLLVAFGSNRASTSLLFSLYLLFNAISSPIMGRIIDRYSPRKVFTLGAVSLATALLALSGSADIVQAYFIYSALGMISAALGTGVMASMISKWFTDRKGLAIGLGTSGFSAGLMVMIPLISSMIEGSDWRSALRVLTLPIYFLLIPLFLIFMKRPSSSTYDAGGKGNPGDDRLLMSPSDKRRSLTDVSVRKTVRTRSFVLLAGSFFVCGFTTVGLVGTHLIPDALDHGIGPTEASAAQGVEGGATILGLVAAGALSDRFGRAGVLSGVYLVRGLMLLFLTTVRDPVALFTFAVVFGVVDLATIPLTGGLTGDIFGIRSVGVLFGLVVMSHQLGGALGSFMGGYLHDLTGSYFAAQVAGAALAMAASVMSIMIREGGSTRLPLRPKGGQAGLRY